MESAVGTDLPVCLPVCKSLNTGLNCKVEPVEYSLFLLICVPRSGVGECKARSVSSEACSYAPFVIASPKMLWLPTVALSSIGVPFCIICLK